MKVLALILLTAAVVGCESSPASTSTTTPSTASTTSASSPATTKPAASVTAPAAAPARNDPLPRKPAFEDAKKGIAAQVKPTDPIKVIRADVKNKVAPHVVELELENTTNKTIVAFKGYVYGYDALDEPVQIALGDRFVKFVSHEGMKMAPGKSTDKYKSYYDISKVKTALVEIVKVKFEDGSGWQRGD
jgi:hypothetical protein